VAGSVGEAAGSVGEASGLDEVGAGAVVAGSGSADPGDEPPVEAVPLEQPARTTAAAPATRT
jgi:hypothetical protein